MTASHHPVPLFDNLDQLSHEMPTMETLITPSLLPAVRQDYQQARDFLYAYRGSLETFKAYRRDVERLLQWSWFVLGKSLPELRREHIEQFLEFCQTPPKHWIGLKQTPRFIERNGLRVANLEWRPFVASVSKRSHRQGHAPSAKTYALSQSALQAIFAILSSFYKYLEQTDYVRSNPVAQIRQKSKFLRKKQGKKIIRRLSELQWMTVIETAEVMAQENPVLHERTLFIMNALFGLYLRISELAASSRWIPQMGHFYKDMDGHWWFKTVGKGNKERDISVSVAMLDALKRYRHSMLLSALPAPGETLPLIPRTFGPGPIAGTRHIRKIVQSCFDQAIDRLTRDGFLEDADMLMAATVHWLRHTGISEDVKTRPREHVRDDAGHSSSAITDQYIDIELRARHASAQKKRLKF